MFSNLSFKTDPLCPASGPTTSRGSLSGLGEVREIAARSQYRPLLLQHSAKTRWEDSGGKNNIDAMVDWHV